MKTIKKLKDLEIQSLKEKLKNLKDNGFKEKQDYENQLVIMKSKMLTERKAQMNQ